MILIDDATWSYAHAETASLHGISLSVGAGELVVLCGASGSGKSTALRLMNGLIPHFHEDGTLHGEIAVDGLRTREAELDAIGTLTGSVLQHPRRQFFTDTVTEELAFAMENFGTPPDLIRRRVTADVAKLTATVPTSQRISRMSGGQQQQVAIAAAAAHAPGVLLLDEPSSNLSADAVTRLAADLAALKRRGTTIIIAEHRLGYLRELLDRVVVMRDGAVDIEWTAAQFRLVSDEALAREGLRGEAVEPALPSLPAVGASVLSPTEQASTTPQPGLELRNVRCRRGGRTVLDIEHVVFPAGTVSAIRGINGAGKSTLARVITGLTRSGGVLRLDGRVLRRRQRQGASAIVMQDVQRQLFTDSVRAEMELALAGNRLDAEAVLAELDLAHLADRHPLALSGGQQQRLVVATARVAQRRIVVFDEPSSGVDRRHLQSISDQIRQVAADGAVVLLISHDDDLLALAADHQLVLDTATSSPLHSPHTP